MFWKPDMDLSSCVRRLDSVESYGVTTVFSSLDNDVLEAMLEAAFFLHANGAKSGRCHRKRS